MKHNIKIVYLETMHIFFSVLQSVVNITIFLCSSKHHGLTKSLTIGLFALDKMCIRILEYINASPSSRRNKDDFFSLKPFFKPPISFSINPLSKPRLLLSKKHYLKYEIDEAIKFLLDEKYIEEIISELTFTVFYEIKQNGKNYLSSMKREKVRVWFPHIVSIIALIASIIALAASLFLNT